MKKDNKIFVSHILESAGQINKFLENVSLEDFRKSIEKQDAVIRRLEIIGEAAKNITKNFRDKYPDIPWGDMAKMRDKLIHGYFGVDIDLTYLTAIKDIPELKKRMLDVLEKETWN